MKFTWAFFIFIACTRQIHAQPGHPLPYEDKLSVRFSPLGLVDVFDGNITAGILHSLSQRWSVSVDLSYIFYSTYIEPNKGTTGYILKPAVRYYVEANRKYFFESTVWYKRSRYKITDWLDKDCVNGVPAYQEFKTFHYLKQVAGFNFQGGFQKGLMKNNLLRMEIYAGIGVRYKWQDVKNEPNACYEPASPFQTNIYDPYIFSASVPHGIRIVYVIR